MMNSRINLSSDAEIIAKYESMPDLKPEIKCNKEENYLTYGDVFDAIKFMLIGFGILVTPVILLLFWGINR